MRLYRNILRVVLVCFALALGASGVYAQPRHGGGGDHRNREWQAVLNNGGHRTHTFQLKDNRDSDNRVYTVAPRQQHATRRFWHGDTSVFVDGQFLGKLRDISQLQEGSNGRVWVVELHRERRRH